MHNADDENGNAHRLEKNKLMPMGTALQHIDETARCVLIKPTYQRTNAYSRCVTTDYRSAHRETQRRPTEYTEEPVLSTSGQQECCATHWFLNM